MVATAGSIAFRSSHPLAHRAVREVDLDEPPVGVTDEEHAPSLPSRAPNLAAMLIAAGGAPARIRSETRAAWPYDDFGGPAELDPWLGRVEFIVLDERGMPLATHPRSRRVDDRP